MDVLSANHFYLHEEEIKSVFRGEIPCWKLVYASDRKSCKDNCIYTTPTDLLTRLFCVTDCLCLMHYLHYTKNVVHSDLKV